MNCRLKYCFIEENALPAGNLMMIVVVSIWGPDMGELFGKKHSLDRGDIS